jgi:hypothetical protein
MRGSVLNPPGTAKIRSYPHGLIFDYVLLSAPIRAALHRSAKKIRKTPIRGNSALGMRKTHARPLKSRFP